MEIKHDIEWLGETTVSDSFRRRGGSTGAWGTGGDEVVNYGYHCKRCQARGTVEEINQIPCGSVQKRESK